jgi:hypothetical protein
VLITNVFPPVRGQCLNFIISNISGKLPINGAAVLDGEIERGAQRQAPNNDSDCKGQTGRVLCVVPAVGYSCALASTSEIGRRLPRLGLLL